MLAVGPAGWGPVPEPIDVLECDGEPSSTGSDLSPGDLEGSSSDPEQAVLRAMSADVVAPRSGYLRLAADEHRQLFVYRANGRVKAAVLVRDDGWHGPRSAWAVTAFRRCQLEELGADVDLGPDWDIWVGPDGDIACAR